MKTLKFWEQVGLIILADCLFFGGIVLVYAAAQIAFWVFLLSFFGAIALIALACCCFWVADEVL